MPVKHWMTFWSLRAAPCVTGGAWIVGYKAWGALLAQRLSQQGVIVACIDYRNFPQARDGVWASPVARLGHPTGHCCCCRGSSRLVML